MLSKRRKFAEGFGKEREVGRVKGVPLGSFCGIAGCVAGSGGGEGESTRVQRSEKARGKAGHSVNLGKKGGEPRKAAWGIVWEFPDAGAAAKWQFYKGHETRNPVAEGDHLTQGEHKSHVSGVRKVD